MKEEDKEYKEAYYISKLRRRDWERRIKQRD